MKRIDQLFVRLNKAMRLPSSSNNAERIGRIRRAIEVQRMTDNATDVSGSVCESLARSDIESIPDEMVAFFVELRELLKRHDASISCDEYDHHPVDPCFEVCGESVKVKDLPSLVRNYEMFSEETQ